MNTAQGTEECHLFTDTYSSNIWEQTVRIIILFGKKLIADRNQGMLANFWSRMFFSSSLSKNLMIKVYGTIILPVVLYGCKTWSPTLREEHKRSVFENRVLRGMFGANRNEVTGEWSKVYKEEVNDLYFSPVVVRFIKSR
jgi:hypothetical protein